MGGGGGKGEKNGKVFEKEIKNGVKLVRKERQTGVADNYRNKGGGGGGSIYKRGETHRIRKIAQIFQRNLMPGIQEKSIDQKTA
jgi:hypothetical protein